MSQTKIEELEALARDYIGSQRKPVLYFASIDGVITAVSTDELAAKRAVEPYVMSRTHAAIIEKSDYGVWWENAYSLEQSTVKY